MPIEIELSDLFQKIVTGLTGIVAAMVIGIYWDLRKRISKIEENAVSRETFMRLESEIKEAIKEMKEERRSDAVDIKLALADLKTDITGTHRRIDEAVMRGANNGKTSI